MTATPEVRELLHAIANGDAVVALRMLDDAPNLAKARLSDGATRQTAAANFLPTLECYLNAGDTALHIAAAAWRVDVLERLIADGAEVMSRNRLGATPLHYAADGNPDSARWNPSAQSETIAMLIAAGGDPNAPDNNHSTPLHRAVRTRCAAATEALLRGGADPTVATKHGSSPLRLANVTSGRGGSGSVAAKAQQAQILVLLHRSRGQAVQ